MGYKLKRMTILLVTFLLVTLILLFTIWAITLTFQRPSAGATWSYVTGKVQTVESHGPAKGILRQGDIILTINGQSVWIARGFPNSRTGDMLHFIVLRGGKAIEATITLSHAQTLLTIGRLSPMLIGFLFWVLGIFSFLLDRSDARWWVFFYGQIICLSLVSGAISSYSSQWIGFLFGFLLWWDGPLAVNVHLRIFRCSLTQWKKMLSIILWGVAAALALVGTLCRVDIIHIGNQLLLAIEYGWLGVNFLFAIIVTISGYSRLADHRVPHTRISMLGLLTSLSLLPILMLGLIPDVLFGRPTIPYELSFLALILIPVGYGITLFEDRFENLFKSLGRVFSIAFTILILTILYLGMYYGFLVISQSWNRTILLTGLVIPLLIITTIRPIYRLIARLVDLLVFGKMYDFRTAIEETESLLRDAGNTPNSVAERLCISLKHILQVDFTCLLLSNGYMVTSLKQDDSSITSQILNETCMSEILDGLKILSSQEEIRQHIFKIITHNNVENSKLMEFIAQAKILITLHGSKNKLGLLFLGKRMGLYDYEANDLRLLECIVEQGSIAIENAFLLNEVQEHITQTVLLHRQILQTREDERKRVSRDLHDDVIQSLVAINYKICELKRMSLTGMEEKYSEVQEDIRMLCYAVRKICAELRPPTLDTVGLIPALQSRISELNQQEYYQTFFYSRIDETQEIPESSAVCLFRVFQEAINNIRKHSSATIVKIDIKSRINEICLSIEDNGVGFSMPSHMNDLIRNYHFGLVGLREMLEAVGGRLTVESEPGNGCRIIAIIPQEETEVALKESCKHENTHINC